MHGLKKKKVKEGKILSEKEISLAFDTPPSHPRDKLCRQFPLSFKDNLCISEFADELYVPLKNTVWGIPYTLLFLTAFGVFQTYQKAEIIV